MKTFIVTYDHDVYRPSTFELAEIQKQFKAEVRAYSLEEAKEIFKRLHKKIPMYFKFTEL